MTPYELRQLGIDDIEAYHATVVGNLVALRTLVQVLSGRTTPRARKLHAKVCAEIQLLESDARQVALDTKGGRERDERTKGNRNVTSSPKPGTQVESNYGTGKDSRGNDAGVGGDDGGKERRPGGVRHLPPLNEKDALDVFGLQEVGNWELIERKRREIVEKANPMVLSQFEGSETVVATAASDAASMANHALRSLLASRV